MSRTEDFKKGRNSTISPMRLELENFMREMPEGETVSTVFLSQKFDCTVHKVSTMLRAMRMDGLVVNKNLKSGVGQWCASEKSRNPDRKAEGDPAAKKIRMENGSPEYWARNHANAMGTPRL